MKILILQDNIRAMDATALANTVATNYDSVRHTSRLNSIDHLIQVAGGKPDLILVAGGGEQFGLIPGLKKANIPTAVVGFKEYREAVRAYEVKWCRAHGAIPFTWCPHHQDWTDTHDIKFNYLPFGADPNLHREYNEPKLYDMSFLGQVHHQDRYDMTKGATDMGPNFQNIRARSLNLMRKLQERTSLNIRIPPLSTERGIFEHTAIYKGEKYARRLNQSKTWLCTTSALDVVNPRFFECMGSRTLIFCNESESYKGLFEPGVHCVTYKMDLSDFEEKLTYYATHDEEREKIIDAAYNHFILNHTWTHRAKELVRITINA